VPCQQCVHNTIRDWGVDATQVPRASACGQIPSPTQYEPHLLQNNAWRPNPITAWLPRVPLQHRPWPLQVNQSR
jgi:hypothetical protein